MANYLNLQVPQGCHEDWNSMLPDQQGKFCLSCQKQVVDFTTMSDRQLIEFFKTHKGSTCGRLNSEQLDRDILIPQKKIPWLRYLFQITIPAFLLSLKATGQSKNKMPQVETVSTIKGNVETGIADNATSKSQTVKGVVQDPHGMPIPWASVMIQGTDQGVLADSAGRFEFKNLAVGTRLLVSSVGFQSREVTVPSNSNSVVLVPLSLQLTGEVVVVGYTVRTSRKLYRAEKKAVCVKPIDPELSIYPNPMVTNSQLHLKWKGLTVGNYTIDIYSISGALVHTQKLEVESWMNEYVLQPKLMAGNYVVTVTNSKDGKRLSQQLQVVY